MSAETAWGRDCGVGTGDIATEAAALAEGLLAAALAQQTRGEHAEAEMLGRMMKDPRGKAFTFAMVDEVFRSHQPAIEAKRWRGLLELFGVPAYLPAADQMKMRAGAAASRLLPGLVMKSVANHLRAQTERVILPGEPEPLREYLAARAAQGFRINLNHLGEAVLGEEEAERRLQAVLTHLAKPEVNYISVKISAIFSQINLIAWDESLADITARLRRLYRAAAEAGKFVNLDMEEYRDLALTMAAFRALLDEPEFRRLSAGIVLQGYLPDSFAAQRELTDWARARVAAGGAPVKLRLVKGANLAMETVEAAMHGWQRAPYGTKAETDANYRRMLEYGCQPANAAAVRLGVASHNLFDVALGLTLRKHYGVEDRVEIEMLEGMANHQARAVRDAAGGLLLYAPAVREDDFMSAMAYLVRRLDENTAPENFLHDMFAMRPGSPEWAAQKARFLEGWNNRGSVSTASRRLTPAIDAGASDHFENEPDTDWTQAPPRTALREARRRWQPVPLPALPGITRMLDTAVSAVPAWAARGIASRAAVLNQAAQVLAAQRFDTLVCMQTDGKKAFAEADIEITEAIDFARYYSRTFQIPPGARAEPMGVVAVVSPWNFPYAIPAGGVLAALMAGNAVVLKPAPATVQIAWLLVQQLWEAGVPREALHFYPCEDAAGQALITDSRIAGVILTGSYDTARKFQAWRPALPLMAETSGKNALVITAQADRELAIKDLVRSAFGHSGQKCSAASLAILEAEVYDDPAFRRQLRDAAASLPAGPSSDPQSVITPLVKPTAALMRAFTTLDAGEQWLLEPRQSPGDSTLWTPGIKLGVRPGSFFHRTECFGPVLGLMRAESLAEAVKWQNDTGYGLTAGLHSLDPAEIDWWRDRVEAGNLYINRQITGAIVQRQPFGGWKRSCIGPGAKAGGPNYVRSLCRWSDADAAAPPDYEAAWRDHFSQEHDPTGLRAESNVFRYRRCKGVILRLDTRDEQSIARAQLASRLASSPLAISIRAEEPDADFIARLPEMALHAEFLRTAAPPADAVLRAAEDAGLNWIDAPFIAAGRIELTRWLREQSVARTRHRYGQLPAAGARR
ncbi:MAG TPA: bifunctional proline dehydrogenase/L-glutamate gamma-semialdehyde dehydrogenase [Chthoniobacteraceae bacterium]|jgi:RHH-type proline utilization regulon transcriptional repressor/proline dehydrogenase/delta 1-pyrroline-5-carboxylate dehydrogenase|nr:bifunctional proline dehydrogenase/L-glutamate gamma-semialdehyde dehydrogenase [Chthoniobacteraceae bacterium]